MGDFTFSNSYIYKLHVLTKTLDKLLDQILINRLSISWSQIALLLAVNDLQQCDQATLARFLGVSPAAISRQVELARSSQLIDIRPVINNRRKNTIQLTTLGRKTVDQSLHALAAPLSQLFELDQSATSLESHLKILLMNSEEVLSELKQSPDYSINY